MHRRREGRRARRARGSEVLRGALGLDRVELGGDDTSAAGVPHRRRQVDAGNAERGPELDNDLGPPIVRQHIKQRPTSGETGISAFAHQLGPLALVRRLWKPLERDVHALERLGVVVVRPCEQLREQAGDRRRIQRGHGVINSPISYVQQYVVLLALFNAYCSHIHMLGTHKPWEIGCMPVLSDYTATKI